MQRRPIWRQYPDFFRRAPALIHSLRWCPHQLEGLHGLVLLASATDIATLENHRIQTLEIPLVQPAPDAARKAIERRRIHACDRP